MYTPTPKQLDRLSDFEFVNPCPDQAYRYAHLRNHTRQFAKLLIENCPESRQLSLALTKLEETLMWANKAIAKEPPKTPPVSDQRPLYVETYCLGCNSGSKAFSDAVGLEEFTCGCGHRITITPHGKKEITIEKQDDAPNVG